MPIPNDEPRDPSEPEPYRSCTIPPGSADTALRDNDNLIATQSLTAEPRDVQTQQEEEGSSPPDSGSMLRLPTNGESPAPVDTAVTTSSEAETAGPEVHCVHADEVNEVNEVNLRGGGLGGPDAGKPSPLRQTSQFEKDVSPGVAASAAIIQKRKSKEVSISENSPEIVQSQRSIIAYRERLTRDIEQRELASKSPPTSSFAKSNISPVREELSVSPAPGADPSTASTESSKTVRGGMTPGFVARTPSYPFPAMGTPAFNALNPQKTSSPLLRSAGGQFESLILHDMVRSDPSTPASAMTFQPTGHTRIPENLEFPTPNLYDLALMLSAEPGLDAWWNSVVQILTQYYKAERITLSLPADATDIDNVPWGQKATYNAHEEDELSMAYMARGSSMVPSSTDGLSESVANVDDGQKLEETVRPGIQNRHSFTAYEDKQESQRAEAAGSASAAHRPSPIMRSKSHFPITDQLSRSAPHVTLNRQALEEHDAVEEQQPIPSWEAPLVSGREVKGRVLPVLQALDLEADPLIDHNGIHRVIQRGRVIALTRNYPYLDRAAVEKADEAKTTTAASPEDAKKKMRRSAGPEYSSKLSSLFGNAGTSRSTKRSRRPLSMEKTRMASLLSTIDDLPPRPPTPRFEEYEQAPPSPWSQSPAPSPAVRADPSENPFFTDAVVDEESFNPAPSPQDYKSMQSPETIGVDNSWTVLHVPLNHILLSKPSETFRLDSSVLEHKNHMRNPSRKLENGASPDQVSSQSSLKANRRPPIAIISILTPVIPYPANLRHSLDHLAPHLATSFNLCRHYTMLETEVSGLRRRRPSAAGFGGIDHEGRPLADPTIVAQLNLGSSAVPSQSSVTGSITSPSEYSAPSRSIPGSQGGTPTWDPGSFGLIVDRRTPASPGPMAGESYFNSRPRNQGVSGDIPAGTSAQRGVRGKEAPSAADRQHRRSTSLRASLDAQSPAVDAGVPHNTNGNARTSDENIASRKTTQGQMTNSSGDAKDKTEGQHNQQDADQTRRRSPVQGATPQSGHRHTLLHSYGGDFATTFQSLPSSTSLLSKPITPSPVQPLSGAGSVSMAPPSDRLKSLMLDTLPVQVFVALPDTGAIVWVNSRYLVYRGQTVADLVADPWGSLHPDDRDEYLQAWSQSLRTGDAFDRVIRLRRFDGAYRWHQARAITSRDKRGVIVQFIGSYMDIHDQHIAKLKAVHQHEIETSEAKHRLLANLIPQIIFTATEEDGITFANEQWFSYTGQSSESSLGLGFIDFVHPDDLAKCRIPTNRPPATLAPEQDGMDTPSEHTSSTIGKRPFLSSIPTNSSGAQNARGPPLSRNSSSSASSTYDLPTAELSELAKKGIIKVTTDSNGRLSYTTELRLRSKTGEYRWHLVRCVEIDNIDFVGNGASSYFGSATDINDHKLLEAKLKEAMESKGRFLSNMSHEIRTPLIGISGMVSFLQDTALNEEQRDFTNTIQTSANSLLMIINDILDLSKVDAGMMKLKYEWFHTRSLIEDVNELVSTMAIAKRLELNYIVEEDVPSWVKGDKVRIRQVLLNVIGNAIKFTSEGEVFSRCRVVSTNDAELGDNQIMLEFSVIDTGRGFTKEESELIFKPFSQIDGSSTRQHGGSGLGLVISRQLVELHGGKMDGAAVPGKGSTFTFSAKFGLPSPADHPGITSSPPMTASTPSTVVDKRLPSAKSFLLQRTMDMSPSASPSSDAEVASPPLTSSAGSDPSVRSARTAQTSRSSISSVNDGLVRFSEAAKASGQDLSQMQLDMPSGKMSPQVTPYESPAQSRPPMYSILVICRQKYGREAIVKHIEMTLPKDIPHQITAMYSVAEAEKLIGGHESVTFTHVVLNLGSAEEVIDVIDQITNRPGDNTSVLVLSDSAQRQAVLKSASGSKYQQLWAEKRINFVYKPVKPSRFAAIFDPAHERDLSIDLNRSSAAQMVESQKQNYLDVEKRIGNKGYKVLLVEDNPVNQKVLVRYLKKVGIDAEIAADGVECTDKVFSHAPNHYSLILCDLHMPRKDGYQACREIRQWEHDGKHTKLPIIALSANVMSDVQEKCVAAGFSDYVTKPVDFVDLSKAMSKYF
ncbi:hypothetical protein DL765_007090 [Monosporascus sp. GIB2]|nr:hypothetical protein DL765_007090 [Monosporascus sp. GIB2]